MNKMFNGWRKYLFAGALLVLIVFCGYFYYAYEQMEETLVHEKTWEKQQDLAMINGVADMFVELNGEVNVDLLICAVQYIEANYVSTFAQLYDAELNPLTNVHEGIGGGKKHNPLDYPEFIAAVRNNDNGRLKYWYETEQAGGRYIYTTFRWVPTGTSEYLIAVSVSKYTIKEDIDKKVIYGAFALIIISAAFIISTVILLCQLGNIYDSRGGKTKWRKISL